MVALQVRKGLKKPQVADLLGVDIRTVWRVTKLEAETGSVVREPISKGPRRLLNGIDCAVRCVSPRHTHTQRSLKYLESLFERTPDLHLHEIQGDLIINRGIDVSLNTISRTLQKRGFTRKKLMIPAKEQNDWLRGEYCDDLPIPTLFFLFLLLSPVLNMTLNCINYALCFMTTMNMWHETLVKIPWYRYNS